MRTTLYRFFDADGALLYIGITSAGPNRWVEHERNREWWEQVASTTAEHYPTREAAGLAETAAIIAERPPYNSRHSVERPTKPPRVYRRRGTGTVMYRPDRDRWVVVTPNDLWFHFRSETPARVFLETVLALSDPDFRRHLLRVLSTDS